MVAVMMSHTIQTMLLSLILACIFIFGVKLKLPSQGQRYYRRALSFSAGVAITYVFLDLLPKASFAQEKLLSLYSLENSLFANRWIYLGMLLGFILFYGLHMVLTQYRQKRLDEVLRTPDLPYIVQITAFSLYVGLVTYFQVHSIEEIHSSRLMFMIAMGMHFFLIEYMLKRENGEIYVSRGKNIIAAAAVLGWVMGIIVELPVKVSITLASVVGGGVIMNTMITEMPRDRESRYGYFLLGTLLYSGLILFA